MDRPDKIDIKDTNMANFGTELEKNIKKAAGLTERAWDNSGKEPGLNIWRIEKFNVVPWPKDQYGSFYSGDSYIVLHTYKKPGNDSALYWNAHMWVGTFTTQDEAGTAAYKIVELDDVFDRAIVLFREVQGYESELFLSYFGHINIMDGGIESGFKHVPVHKYRPRLLRVCGRRTFKISEVELTSRSLCINDSFILDNGLTVYNFVGSKSNSYEKFKSISIATSIKESRLGKATIINLDETTQDESFWKLLGGRTEVGIRSDAEIVAFEKLLFSLSDASGTMELKEISRGDKVKRQQLKSGDIFILDAGHELFIWVGKGASLNEKRSSLQYLQNYMNKNNRPAHLPICSMQEGRETEAFESAFKV